MALVVTVDAVGGIGEPDRAVRFDDHVVGRVQLLALIPVGEHADRSVMLDPATPASTMLAGDEPSLAVSRMAVVKAARGLKNRNGSVG